MVTSGSQPTPSSGKKFDHIDALRGIAVLLVVFVHTGGRTPEGQWFGEIAQYGQYGVQLFFVLSAFTLCHSMSKLTALEKRDYMAFMTKRFFRIAPLYYLGIIVYFAFTYLSYRFAHQTPFTEPGEYSILGVMSNVLFLHGLVPQGNSNVVPGGWSIGCEFLFYAFFPFLFLRARNHKSFLLLGAIAAAGCTYALHLTMSRLQGSPTELNSFTYFSVFNQFPSFAMGMIYYFYGKIRAVRAAMLFLFLPSLALIYLLHNVTWGWWLLPLVAGIASVGLSMAVEKVTIPSALKRIGQWSFSIYLWHFLVVWNVSYAFKMNLPHEEIVSVLQFVVIVIITSTIAAVSHHLIELPGISHGSKIAGRLKVR